MPDTIHVFIGQVWKNKKTNERVCIGGIRKEAGQVWLNRMIGEANTIIPVAHLAEYYEIEGGWKFD